MATDIYARVVGHILAHELKLDENTSVHNVAVLAWGGMGLVSHAMESRTGRLKVKLLYAMACDLANHKDMYAQAAVLDNNTWYGARWFANVPEDVDKLAADLVLYTRQRPVFPRMEDMDQVLAVLNMESFAYAPECNQWQPTLSPPHDSPIYVPDSPPASPSLLAAISGPFGNAATDPLRS